MARSFVDARKSARSHYGRYDKFPPSSFVVATPSTTASPAISPPLAVPRRFVPISARSQRRAQKLNQPKPKRKKGAEVRARGQYSSLSEYVASSRGGAARTWAQSAQA